VMEVTAQVLEGGKPAATYVHKVRKSYPLEEFDFYGRFNKGDWRPMFLYLTQNTFWASRKERFPANHRPLRDFIQASLAQGGVSASGAPVTPGVDSLNSPEKLRKVIAHFHLDTLLQGSDLPSNRRVCEGEDAGQPFTAIAPETIRWKDTQIPQMVVPRSHVDGFLVMPHTILCDGERNRFWLAAYHMGRLNLWQYRLDFNARSLRVEQWLQADVPPEAKKLFDAMRRKNLWIGGIRGGAAELYMVNLQNDRFGKRIAENGYRIDVSLN